MSINGTWSADISAAGIHGGMVVTLKDGDLEGGDATHHVHGHYSVTGDAVSAEFTSSRHRDGAAGVPALDLGLDAAQVNVSATVSGDTINGTVSSPVAPGLTADLVMKRIR